jgi:YVTN family beta-propeller protein
VADGADGTLLKVSPVYHAVVKTISGLAGPLRVSGGQRGSVALGDGSVWVAYGSTAVARVNAKTNTGRVVGYAGFGASGIDYGKGSLWIPNETANTVTQFSPLTNHKIRDCNVGKSPSGVAVGGGAVWVTDTGDNTVSRLDPATCSATTTPVGRAPVGIAYGEGSVWVANSGSGTVSRINPDNGTVITIPVGGSPTGIAAGSRLVWVTVQAPA